MKMIFPAKIVVGRKVVEDAFPDWNSVLKSERVELFISKTVEKLNKDCEEARNRNRMEYAGPSSDPVQDLGQGHRDRPIIAESQQSAASSNSERGSMTDNARSENGGAVRFKSTEVMPSSFSATTGVNRREPLGSSETCIEMESNESEQGTGDDDDEDDHVFYSNYVSRMGQSSSYKDKGESTQKRQDNETIKTPQIVSMKDFPPLGAASSAKVNNQPCNSKNNGNSSNSSGANRPTE